MDPERWRKIESVYHAALEREESERAAFLAAACAGDESLRREVESLLTFQSRSEDFMESPAAEVAASTRDSDGTSSPDARVITDRVGKTVSHYEILERIGSGGMGVIYKAKDNKLKRTVALKFPPEELFGDRQTLERFQREARAASSLNHPNICTIYDIDDDAGHPFISMEFLKGQAFKDHMEGRPLKTAVLLDLAIQIAEGLDAAHRMGIMHRDIKPANLFLTHSGIAKILDFGLAKLYRETPRAAEGSRGSAFPTQAGTDGPGTTPGLIIGTAAYMSPEQARGEELDARTDIFSFGVVLYEMATGVLPFKGKIPVEILAAILHQAPDPPLKLNPGLPPALEAILAKALEKDRALRYQSVRDLITDLRRLKRDTDSAHVGAHGVRPPETAPAEKGTRRVPLRLRWTVALIGGALVAVAAALVTLNVGGLRERFLTAVGARQGVPLPKIKSLAVLPLENLSGDPAQEYFADGMTEELISSLGKVSALKVISRTSTMRYKASNKPLPVIARELGVDGIIEGSVRRAGNEVRIKVQLIEAASDQHLWAESYQRNMRDILALQSEVAQAITREIKIAVTPEEQSRLAIARPVDPEAYQLYLKGRYEWSKRTEEGLKKGLESFQQAIRADSSSALAYSGVADSYGVLGHNAFLPGREAYPKAKAAALKALELDESSAEAHASLAPVLFDYYWDREGALREYRRAIELNPNYSTAHHWYAVALVWMGRPEEAIREIYLARELDPLSDQINANVGQVLYSARQYDKAIVESRRTLELEPSNREAYNHLSKAYGQKGMKQEALAAAQQLASLEPDRPRTLSNLAYTYALAGRRVEALEIFGRLKQMARREFVSPYHIAVICVGLGEKDEALGWLEEGAANRDAQMGAIKVDPRLDPLRSDPRLQDLLRRMNFPP